MYSMSQIKRLQKDQQFYDEEANRYCLVRNFLPENLTKKDVENQCNFCILRIIHDHRQGLLTPKEANDLINKIDVFEYSLDLLGPAKVIHKLNVEIIQESLHLPFFNQLCVLCDDLYDDVR